MHRDPAGAGTLNTLLQEILAPARDNIPERQHGARVFRPGDKVIQIRNNYPRGNVASRGIPSGTPRMREKWGRVARRRRCLLGMWTLLANFLRFDHLLGVSSLSGAALAS